MLSPGSLPQLWHLLRGDTPHLFTVMCTYASVPAVLADALHLVMQEGDGHLRDQSRGARRRRGLLVRLFSSGIPAKFCAPVWLILCPISSRWFFPSFFLLWELFIMNLGRSNWGVRASILFSSRTYTLSSWNLAQRLARKCVSSCHLLFRFSSGRLRSN
jgi:hypothetical protein